MLKSLLESNIGFAIFDRRFRFQFANEALAAMNRIPAQDHIGEHARKIAGEVALRVEPTFHAVFDTGRIISGLQIMGRLPKRSDVCHWTATWFPIRDPRERVKQVGTFVVEVSSYAQSGEVASGRNQRLLERVSLNTKLLRQLLRLQGDRSLLRADPQRILDGMKEAAREVGSRQEQVLSPREREIVSFLANGRSNKEISAALNISVKTVECYRSKVFLKLKLDSIASLVQYAIRNHIVDL